MALKRFKSGGPVPPRILIHGAPKTGKSTFASQAPNPVFLPTEDGLGAINGVERFDLITSYDGLIEALDDVTQNPADKDGKMFGTVVLDSADWTEPLLMQSVARDHGMEVYDATMKGSPLAFGRGSEAVADKWRIILRKLDYMRDNLGMASIIIAHSKVRKQTDAFVDAYDKHVVDLMKGSTGVLEEWADVIGYCASKVGIKTEKSGIGDAVKRGISISDTNYLYTSNRPECLSGSRWNLPPEMPLNYAVFHDNLVRAMSPPQALQAA